MAAARRKKTYTILANLTQMWLTQFDRDEFDADDAAADTIAQYEAKIGALERKVGQLMMELDLLKKNTPTASRERQRAVHL